MDEDLAHGRAAAHPRATRRSPVRPYLLAACAAAAALLATPASAGVSTQWDGALGISCTQTLYGLPCVNGTVRSSDSGFSATGRTLSGHAEITSDYAMDVFGRRDPRHLATQWSASAAEGKLRASSFSDFVMPMSSVRNPSEHVGSLAEAVFTDTWLIHGPAVGTRRISAHFSLGGSIGDLGGIAVVGNQVNAPFGAASADFSVDFGLTGGVGQPIVVQSPDGSSGAATRAGGSLHRTLNDGVLTTQGLSFVFDVADGNVLDVLAHLIVRSTLSAYADFAHTATLDYILAPDDVGITAGSGELLRSGDRFVYTANAGTDPTPPGSDVPEPASFWLVLGGLGVLLSRHGTRRAGRPQPKRHG